MLLKIMFLIIALLIFSCSLMQNTWAIANTVPMYGHIEKPPEIVEIDRVFIADAITQFNTRDSASIVYNTLAWNYLFDNQNETAIRRFNQAWLLDSTNAGPYFGFAAHQELTASGKHERYFQMAVDRDIERTAEKDYWHKMALYYQIHMNFSLAASYYSHVIEISDHDTLALKYRGYMYSRMQEWDLALNDLFKAIDLGVNNYLIYDKIGFAFMNLGDDEKALYYFEKSYTLKTDFLYPLYRSSLIHLKLKNYDQALEFVNKCLAIKSDEKQFIKTKKEIEALIRRK